MTYYELIEALNSNESAQNAREFTTLGYWAPKADNEYSKWLVTVEKNTRDAYVVCAVDRSNDYLWRGTYSELFDNATRPFGMNSDGIEDNWEMIASFKQS